MNLTPTTTTPVFQISRMLATPVIEETARSQSRGVILSEPIEFPVVANNENRSRTISRCFLS